MQQIKVKPNKDGKIIITLFGTNYEIIVENEEVEKCKKVKTKA